MSPKHVEAKSTSGPAEENGVNAAAVAVKFLRLLHTRPHRRKAYDWLLAAVSDDDDQCLLWPFAKDKNGYPQLNIGGRTTYVTRLLCEAAYGPAPTAKHHAAHDCGNGHLGCIRIRHLALKTPTANAADKHVHGTVVSKLSSEDVDLMRQDAVTGRYSQRALARKFGISQAQVWNILHKIQWRSHAA
jgi:hypothetical protein